jgi:hypothetical protein
VTIQLTAMFHIPWWTRILLSRMQTKDSSFIYTYSATTFTPSFVG